MDSHDAAHLAPLDQEALDALVESGFDPARTPENLRPRCTRLAKILGAVDAPTVTTRDGLAARTMDRIIAVRSLTGDTLCVEDSRALDALIDAGYDPAFVGAQHRDRASRLAAIGAALTSSAPRAQSDLAERTFDLVMVAADRPLASLEPGAVRPHPRWLDVLSMAAMLLVGVSVLIPVMAASRSQQMRAGCSANLGTIASAFASYASNYRDSLPVASASMGGVWWDVGSSPSRSNSANLYTLARTGFAKVRDMACPASETACTEAASPEATDWRNIDSVSYSYQIMFGGRRPGWHDPCRTAVLADRSPVVLRAIAHQPIIPTENSPNHSRRGQGILLCDGSFRWQNTPVLETGDNIWLPWEIEEILRQISAGEEVTLEGKEVPGSDRDSFLAP